MLKYARLAFAIVNTVTVAFGQGRGEPGKPIGSIAASVRRRSGLEVVIPIAAGALVVQGGEWIGPA